MTQLSELIAKGIAQVPNKEQHDLFHFVYEDEDTFIGEPIDINAVCILGAAIVGTDTPITVLYNHYDDETEGVIDKLVEITGIDREAIAGPNLEKLYQDRVPETQKNSGFAMWDKLLMLNDETDVTLQQLLDVVKADEAEVAAGRHFWIEE